MDMKTESGTVVAFNVSEERGIQKTSVDRVCFVVGSGIDGDAHAGDWHRQVSLLAEESVDKMRARGLKLAPGAFAENITTRGIDVPSLRVGDLVHIGEVELEVTQIGKECHARCEIFYAAGDCVMPREGVFARVLAGGEAQVGARVAVLRQAMTNAADAHPA